MKIFLLILSTIIFVVSGYFLLADFNTSSDTNATIYLCLLIVLMLVCIVGILINLPSFPFNKKKNRPLFYNSYSDKRIKNQTFDKNFKFLKNI